MAGPDLTTDTVLAGYRILGPIGRGGMGVVYRAEEPALGRLVALKVLAPALAAHEEFRQRFLREMRLAASIEHPNILPIYRAGEDQGLLYLAMRYVDAHDLREVLRRGGPLGVGRALWIAEQVAQALDAAHQCGLVHRDVKPANILLTAPTANGREHAYLVDFGVARPITGAASITSGGMILGTPSYAAPEQLTGGPVDARTDVYALGCVLYECLSGRPPFAADSDQALILAHLHATPPPVRSVRRDLPAALDGALARALAKPSQQRYRSCGELTAAARRAVHGGAAPVPFGVRAPASGARSPAAPPPPRPAIPGRFLSLLAPADRVRRVLWLMIALAIVGAAANLNDTAPFRRLSGEPPGPGAPSPLANGVFAAEGIVLLATAVLFLLWFRRAYRNLAALGARGLRFSDGWAIGAWFVPILSLVRPKQLLNDIWRASNPDLPVDDDGSWRRRPVPSVLTWWWLAFLASMIARAITTESVHTLAVVMTFGLASRPLDQVQPTSGIQSLADLLSIVASLLALRIVRLITARQEARAARLATSPPHIL
jgi:serine/threonine protein kinase